MGAQRGLLLAANHPERVEAAVFIGPTTRAAESHCRSARCTRGKMSSTPIGLGEVQQALLATRLSGFLDFFLSRVFTEPHSTKPIEDGVGWGLETTGETLALTHWGLDAGETRELARRVRCPVLVIHGDHDGQSDVSRGIALAEHTGGQLIVLDGSGHAPHLRDPVKVNLLLRDFVKPAAPPRSLGAGEVAS